MKSGKLELEEMPRTLGRERIGNEEEKEITIIKSRLALE